MTKRHADAIKITAHRWANNLKWKSYLVQPCSSRRSLTPAPVPLLLPRTILGPHLSPGTSRSLLPPPSPPFVFRDIEPLLRQEPPDHGPPFPLRWQHLVRDGRGIEQHQLPALGDDVQHANVTFGASSRVVVVVVVEVALVVEFAVPPL